MISNAGYCFVEFPNPDSANKALALNGTPVPNSSRQFKLNWASGGGLVDRRYVLLFDLLIVVHLPALPPAHFSHCTSPIAPFPSHVTHLLLFPSSFLYLP
jgi:hypothetical protein